ncbi:unnamed protein product, partial [Protopolystoma xenopodis]
MWGLDTGHTNGSDLDQLRLRPEIFTSKERGTMNFPTKFTLSPNTARTQVGTKFYFFAASYFFGDNAFCSLGSCPKLSSSTPVCIGNSAADLSHHLPSADGHLTAGATFPPSLRRSGLAAS